MSEAGGNDEDIGETSALIVSSSENVTGHLAKIEGDAPSTRAANEGTSESNPNSVNNESDNYAEEQLEVKSDSTSEMEHDESTVTCTLLGLEQAKVS